MSIKLIRGYRYTTKVVINYGEEDVLKKLAKSENKKLKKDNRIERYVVYPVPGKIAGMAQLCILY